MMRNPKEHYILTIDHPKEASPEMADMVMMEITEETEVTPKKAEMEIEASAETDPPRGILIEKEDTPTKRTEGERGEIPSRRMEMEATLVLPEPTHQREPIMSH